MQENFFKLKVLEFLTLYTWVEFPDNYNGIYNGKYRLISVDTNSNYVGGNTGSTQQQIAEVFLNLVRIVDTFKPPYDTYKLDNTTITDWERILSVTGCDDLPGTVVATYKEDKGEGDFISWCRTYKNILAQGKDFAPIDVSLERVLSLLQDGGYLVLDAVGLEIGCKDWCDKNVSEYI